MLVNSKKLLAEARASGCCMAAFNVYNLETMQAVFAAAKIAGVPVILAFGESYLSHTSLEVVVAIVRVLDRDFPLAAVLHLDHCTSLHTVRQAMEAGFTSVMYDGSRLSLSENIQQMQYVVDSARAYDVSVEGELGSMNDEDGQEKMSYCAKFTDPAQARAFVLNTGIDALALSVGNAHGVYKGKPQLDFSRLEAISQLVDIPLVLHGCSGIPREDVARAARLGVAKINVNTEVALAGGRCLKDITVCHENPVRMEKLMAAAQDAMQKAMGPFLDFYKAPTAGLARQTLVTEP